MRGTALLLSAIMVTLLPAHYLTPVNGMLLFWIAFILTRPLGAVLGNILSKSRDHGGLDWGNASATGVLVAALIGLVRVSRRFRSTATRCCRCRPRSTAARVKPERPNGQLITLPQS